MKQVIQEALNQQIRMELTAFYTYLSMSAYLEAQDWPGSAQWMRQHSEEEMMHAMKIYDFINNCNGRVILQAIDQPPTEFDSIQNAFAEALAHERRVTAAINHIYDLARAEQDYPTQVLMEWFVQEQVEEEKIVEDALVMIRRAGDNPFQLLYVDNLLAGQQAAGAP